MKRALIACFLIALVATAGFTGGRQEAAVVGEPLQDISWSDFDWPNELPSRPVRLDDSVYDFADLSEPMEFEMINIGFVNTPLPDTYPIREYLAERFNTTIDLQSYNRADHETTLAARFAAGDGPDVAFVHRTQRDLAQRLYEAGQLLDASLLIPYMPQFANYVTDTFARFVSFNEDEWVGFPRYPIFPNNWGMFIRQDFLDNLGMDHPTNLEELFEFAVAATFDDPNNSGQQDTWFMGAARGGADLGMLEEIRAFIGHPGWNVVNGRINHPMIDGTEREYLEYVFRLREAGTLAPDWFTIGWEEFKAYSLAGRIGMVRYPGYNIVQETYETNDNDPAMLDVWAPVDPLAPTGLLAPPSGPEGMFVFNANLANQPDRLRRIARVIDGFAYPNPDYQNLIQGGGPAMWPDDVRYEFFPEDGTNIWFREPGTSVPERYAAMGDYQRLGITLIWEVFDAEPGITGGQNNQAILAMPRHENFELLLSLDPDTVADLREFQRRSEIAFVLGERSFSEWDAYVDEWLSRGGRRLLEQAAEQLGVQMADI